MEAKDCIRRRRSIRSYLPTEIRDEDIRDMLEAAVWAPSGKNGQPWRFYVVKEKTLIQAISKLSIYDSFMKDAAAMILVFLDHAASYDDTKDKQAIGAAIQNILLTCEDKGIGACWIGEILRQKQQVNTLLNLDGEALELMAVLTLGYSNAAPVSTRRKLDDVLIGWK